VKHVIRDADGGGQVRLFGLFDGVRVRLELLVRRGLRLYRGRTLFAGQHRAFAGGQPFHADVGGGRGLLLVADYQGGQFVGWTFMPMRRLRDLQNQREGTLWYGAE
jgi:hypothetical protein